MGGTERRCFVTGIGMVAASGTAAPPPPPPPPSPNPSISWTGSSTTIHVIGVSGTTTDHYHCDATGGAGGPYSFVMQAISNPGNFSFSEPSSGESHVSWSSLAVGDSKQLVACAVCTDSGGNTGSTSWLTLTFIRDS